MDLQTYLARSYTAYQATEHAEAMLRENGFEALRENESWHIVVNGKYYVKRGGSSLIAFRVGSRPYFKIVSSHTDSPAIKLKENAEMQSGTPRDTAEGSGIPFLIALFASRDR